MYTKEQIERNKNKEVVKMLLVLLFITLGGLAFIAGVNVGVAWLLWNCTQLPLHTIIAIFIVIGIVVNSIMLAAVIETVKFVYRLKRKSIVRRVKQMKSLSKASRVLSA